MLPLLVAFLLSRIFEAAHATMEAQVWSQRPWNSISKTPQVEKR